MSGSRTAALVELYTSEGCSSCPPADRWLSGLGPQGYAPDRVVPLSLHVDYWDYIGWKDPYAKREFSQRQRKLSQLQRMALVYTPQVVLQGRDFRGWGGKAFGDAVAKINAQVAKARISLEIHSFKGNLLDVSAAAELLDPARSGDPVLYLAAYQNRLQSRVAAGENLGRTLVHDYVVLGGQSGLAGHLGDSFVFGAFRVYGCFARGLSMTGVRPYSAAPLASSSADCWEKVPPEPVT